MQYRYFTDEWNAYCAEIVKMQRLTNGTNITFISEDHTVSTLSIVRIAIYAISLFLGVIGNGVVLTVSIYYRKSLSRSRFLIAHLAITDALFSLRLPIQINLELNGEKWDYGQTFCKIFYSFNSMLMLASIGTMMVIAVERYRGITKPYLAKIKRSSLAISLALVWLVAIITYSPILVFRKEMDGKCKEDHSDMRLIMAYSVFIVTVKYVIPLTVICCCYSRIVSTIKNRPRLHKMQQQRRRERDDNRIVAVLIVMVMAFAVLTLPSSIWWLLVDFGQYKSSDAPMQIIEVFAACVYFHSWVNPIVLFIMDSKFRRDVRCIIKCQHKEDMGSRSGTANGKAIPLIRLSR